MAQQVDEKVRKIKEKVNQDIYTSFQVLFDGLVAIDR
jgi:hypothetical protein